MKLKIKANYKIPTCADDDNRMEIYFNPFNHIGTLSINRRNNKFRVFININGNINFLTETTFSTYEEAEKYMNNYLTLVFEAAIEKYFYIEKEETE